MILYNKDYWLSWANCFIEDIEEENPDAFTNEFKEKIALWLYKMALEQHNNWKRAEG